MKAQRSPAECLEVVNDHIAHLKAKPHSGWFIAPAFCIPCYMGAGIGAAVFAVLISGGGNS